jgi:hypothetical protein
MCRPWRAEALKILLDGPDATQPLSLSFSSVRVAERRPLDSESKAEFAPWIQTSRKTGFPVTCRQTRRAGELTENPTFQAAGTLQSAACLPD